MKTQNNNAVLNFKAIIASMLGLGITSAEVSYSGGGDSGDLNNITFTPEIGTRESLVMMITESAVWNEVDGKWEHVTTETTKPMDLKAAVEEFTWDQVNSNFGGWENTEGGGGTMIINAVEGMARLAHYNNERTEEEAANVEIEPVPNDETKPIGTAVHKVQMLLSQRGYNDVTVSFYGYGDSGSIENVAFNTTSEQSLPIDPDGIFEGEMSLRDFLYDLTESCISDNGMEGYGNDGGGSGSLTITATGNAKFEGVYHDEESVDQSIVTISIHDSEVKEVEA